MPKDSGSGHDRRPRFQPGVCPHGLTGGTRVRLVAARCHRAEWTVSCDSPSVVRNDSRTATLVRFEQPRTGRRPLLCFSWRYSAFACGGIPIPKTPRRPVLDTGPRFSSARTSLAPDQVRGDGVCFLGEVRAQKSRPGAATLRRSGSDPAANAQACLIDGLGTEDIPQQTGLFLGLLPIVRPPPPGSGRSLLRALPLGREHWLPRHGRSPERSVVSGLRATTWRGVNAAGQRMLVGRA